MNKPDWVMAHELDTKRCHAQVACLVYEYVLVRLANASHMRHFLVFLALPSATIRGMASRQLQVGAGGPVLAVPWVGSAMVPHARGAHAPGILCLQRHRLHECRCRHNTTMACRL